MKISVAIPAYEMKGFGKEMLAFSFEQLAKQAFLNFEVVVSDDSADAEIENLCKEWEKDFYIKYIKNPYAKGLSSNLNNAILNSSGDIIKVLCQDDFLLDEESLQRIADSFDMQKGWLVSSYFHTDKHREKFYNLHIPKWNNHVYDYNTIGTHSCLSFSNKSNLLFDTNLIWHMDCEFYYRLFLKYGEPKILEYPTMVQCIWEGQTTNTITNEINTREILYLIRKHEIKWSK